MKVMAEAETLRHAYSEAARCLRSAGLATPELDARLLLCAAAGLSFEAYISAPERALPASAANLFNDYIVRRLEGEPVSRILGYREFYGRRFSIDRSTLDPRPETEILVEAALAIVDESGARDRPLRVLDLGTGSGCLLITLLAELPGTTGIGIDISEAALRTARRNAGTHKVGARAQFVRADWLEPFVGTFDLILANPPYLRSEEIGTLSREVREHDPRRALDGGADGLSAYRRIAERLASALRAGGAALFEIGTDQAEPVADLLRHCGLGPEVEIAGHKDLSGLPRCLIAGPARRAVAGKNCLEKGLLRASFEPAE
jgi:release factor glutamine methyltransferase